MTDFSFVSKIIEVFPVRTKTGVPETPKGALGARFDIRWYFPSARGKKKEKKILDAPKQLGEKAPRSKVNERKQQKWRLQARRVAPHSDKSGSTKLDTRHELETLRQIRRDDITHARAEDGTLSLPSPPLIGAAHKFETATRNTNCSDSPQHGSRLQGRTKPMLDDITCN